jgi:MATE family multidrug resistance protein
VSDVESANTVPVLPLSEPPTPRSTHIIGNISAPGGYLEVLKVAGPLIAATASLTVTLFADRMFLSWHSQASVAAATPAGITFFTICSLFMGTAQYVNTIVAQHHGAGKYRACARAVWQGVIFSTAAAPLILACIPLGSTIFNWGGHSEQLIKLENQYFSILMMGGTLLPLQASLSAFFSGRGKTWVVMWGHILGNGTNIILDYILIFGRLGFPEMGIRGAAIASAITMIIPVVFWLALFLSERYQEKYGTRKEFRFDKRLFSMLLRFGGPAGIQFFLDVASFAVFVILIGRLGVHELAASNIVFSIEMLSFLPMVGMSIATATLVGNYIGSGQHHLAEKSVSSALKLALGYMAVMAMLFVTIPEVFLNIFRPDVNAQQGFDAIMDKGVIILRLVAIWTLFDTLFIIFSGALKGSGDTRFAMWAQIFLAWVLFVPPVYIIIEYLHLGLFGAWSWGTCYVIVLGLVFWLRFRSGRWKEIQMLNRA